MKAFSGFFVQALAQKGLNTPILRLLCTVCLLFFVPQTALAQHTVQRDQEALTIISQTIAAGGGQELLASIHDFTETGAITYNWDEQVTGRVTVKSRKLDQFRIDTELAEGKRTAVINGEAGLLTEANGRTFTIHRQGARDFWSLTLPYLPLIAGMRDSSTSIIYGGTVTHNGASVYDVRLIKVYTAGQDPTGKRGNREARDFFIDPRTFFVVAISDQIQYAQPLDESLPHEFSHEILYSNYQSENGISTPLTIEETVRDVTRFTINLSQVTFNSGMADAEFSW